MSSCVCPFCPCVAAVASLLQQPVARSSMTLGWKALVVALCASWPLLGFALSCGNLSVIAAALSILAFHYKKIRLSWFPAVLLALAVLLKPHLAVWFLLGMFLLPEKQTRAVAARAGILVSGFMVILGVILVAQHTLKMQISGLFSMLHVETSFGASMNVSSREVLLTCAQITSLQSLLGFWTPDRLWSATITLTVLGAAGFWLTQTTLRARTEEEAVVAVGMWSAFGLLATYHRAHDAVALLLLLPYMLGPSSQGSRRLEIVDGDGLRHRHVPWGHLRRVFNGRWRTTARIRCSPFSSCGR